MAPSYRTELGEWLDATSPVPDRDTAEGALRQEVLLGAARRQRRRRAVYSATSVGAVALLMVVGVTGWRSMGHDEAIRFRVDPGMGFGEVGAYVAPASSSPLDLRFTEGSVIELMPGARARVSATSDRGATVLLETGQARVDVVHRPKSDWRIVAGSYNVHVRGTSFTVGFDAATQLFELAMRSGVVTVEGPGISSPIEIRGAQRFVHHAGDSNPAAVEEFVAAARPSDVQGAAATGGGANQVDEPSVASNVPATNASGTSEHVAVSARTASWSARVRRGEYAAVVREAEQQGVPTVMARVSADELLALANAARFLGRVDLGREGYLVLRQRFPSSSLATTAAFLMGRLMEAGSPNEGRKWYERYEQEAPSGPLAAEAMGRRMLLTRDMGRGAEAERLANEYVRRYPDGAYAAVARKIALP
jgi:TolA-binding protein